MDSSKVESYSGPSSQDLWNGTRCMNVNIPSDSQFQAVPNSKIATNYNNKTMNNCTQMLRHKRLPLYVTPLLSLKQGVFGQEWDDPASKADRLAQQQIANFFVREARNNYNRFKSAVRFHTNNIENFPVIDSALSGTSYVVKGLY